jgi:hypothetical protein
MIITCGIVATSCSGEFITLELSMDTPGQEGQTTILKNMKYEFVNGKDDIPCIVENKKCLKPPTSIRLETKQDFQEL